jgi:nitroimidazol reductase NimA-like FMN-containing flavoprotein (pyridoxamine 5'-phosphate oxidase superfamily)
MPKTLPEVSAFMKQVGLAIFTTVDARLRPHAVPVFFTFDDGRVYIQSDRRSVKVRNLKKNDNVAIVVSRGDEAVILRGRGRIVEDEGEFVGRTQEHIEKYHLSLDEQGRDEMGIPLFDRKIRCIIEVTPEKTLFW